MVPAELLQVTYAAQLREFLLSRYREITLVTFERLVFDGILQEVVLFCGVVGPGPAHIRTVRLGDANDLNALGDKDFTNESAPAFSTKRRSGPSTSSTPLKSGYCEDSNSPPL